jgi:hypothetical protein
LSKPKDAVIFKKKGTPTLESTKSQNQQNRKIDKNTKSVLSTKTPKAFDQQKHQKRKIDKNNKTARTTKSTKPLEQQKRKIDKIDKIDKNNKNNENKSNTCTIPKQNNPSAFAPLRDRLIPCHC